MRELFSPSEMFRSDDLTSCAFKSDEAFVRVWVWRWTREITVVYVAALTRAGLAARTFPISAELDPSLNSGELWRSYFSLELNLVEGLLLSAKRALNVGELFAGLIWAGRICSVLAFSD